MEGRSYEPDVWDVAVGYAYQANEARDKWSVVRDTNNRLDAFGIPDNPAVARRTKEGALKAEYDRLNDLVGLMIGPNPDEYKDFMGISDGSNRRDDVIVYMVDGVERFIERK